MDDQINLFDTLGFTEEVFIEKFDSLDVDNEREEDISGIAGMDLSQMAITSTDWTTETIISQLKKGNIILDPEFQRREAWTGKTKSRFIESIFLGLPIPQIILAEQKNKKGKFIVIDGKQRLLSLYQFVVGDNKRLKLTSLEVKEHLNRMSIDDIKNSQYADEIEYFFNQTIRTIVVKNWPSESLLYLLFLRLNTGSVKLSPQELRQALHPGEFVKYVNDESTKCLELKKMLKINKPDFRMRDVEILIRYYAFKYNYESYSGSMQKFLDDFCKKMNDLWTLKKDEIKTDMNEFSNAIIATNEIFGEANAFRKYKNGKYEEKYNRSIIDIMLFYFSSNDIREKSIGKKAEIKNAFEELCNTDNDFLSSIELTTKSLFSVKKRFMCWGEKLSIILDTNIKLPFFAEN